MATKERLDDLKAFRQAAINEIRTLRFNNSSDERIQRTRDDIAKLIVSRDNLNRQIAAMEASLEDVSEKIDSLCERIENYDRDILLAENEAQLEKLAELAALYSEITS